MPVIVKRSDPVYIASIFLAFTLWLGVTVSISKTVSWEKAWKFAMHPLLNSAGVFFMTIGILEQNNTLAHVTMQLLAGVLFISAYWFMFAQHQGLSTWGRHIGIHTGPDGKTDSTRLVHVWTGYLALVCWLTQIAGGLAKFSNLPQKSVRWHGTLATVVFSLTCAAPTLASFITLRHPEGMQWV